MTEKTGSIIDYISEKSQADARAAIATAEKVAQREMDQANRRSATRLQAAANELKAYVDAERTVAQARAAAEASQVTLGGRQELTEGLLAAALKRLAEAARDDAYLGVIERLACDAARQIGAKGAVVVCSARDSDFLTGEGRFGRLAEAARNATGAALELSEETAAISGGVILRTTDGKVSYYNTFEEIAYRRRSELRAIIATELFG